MALDPAARRELHWSHKEKSVARTAFDSALARENASIRREVERMLQSSSEASAVWDVLEFLSSKQREIQRKYDYRYSLLTGAYSPGYFMRAGSLKETLPGSVPRSLSSSDAELEQRGNSMPYLASSWLYTDGVPTERQAALVAPATFDELVELAATEICKIRVRVQPGQDAGLTDCLQPVFSFELPIDFSMVPSATGLSTGAGHLRGSRRTRSLSRH